VELNENYIGFHEVSYKRFRAQGYRAAMGLIFLALNNNTIEKYGYDTAQICLNL
jgi:hypothetical protein